MWQYEWTSGASFLKFFLMAPKHLPGLSLLVSYVLFWLDHTWRWRLSSGQHHPKFPSFHLSYLLPLEKISWLVWVILWDCLNLIKLKLKCKMWSRYALFQCVSNHNYQDETKLDIKCGNWMKWWVSSWAPLDKSKYKNVCCYMGKHDNWNLSWKIFLQTKEHSSQFCRHKCSIGYDRMWTLCLSRAWKAYPWGLGFIWSILGCVCKCYICVHVKYDFSCLFRFWWIKSDSLPVICVSTEPWIECLWVLFCFLPYCLI